MKKITIIVFAILLALYLAAYRPWRTGSRQAEKDLAGGVNVAQDNNRPATGANDVKQPAKDVQQPVTKEARQSVTDEQGAKRHGKGDRRSMTGKRKEVKRHGARLEHQAVESRADYGASGCVPLRCEDLGLQVTGAPKVKHLIIDVIQPTEGIEAGSVKVEGLSIEPLAVVYVKGSNDWPAAREMNPAAPESQGCPTAYDIRLEPRVQCSCANLILPRARGAADTMRQPGVSAPSR